jgi:peptidoglycan/LPS O-acetylase OafA/YrhL
VTAAGVRAEIGHVPAIEGLRGIAVSWVVVFHYFVVRERSDPWVAAARHWDALDRLARNGYLGVDLFFLISGFLLTLPWFAHARSGLAPPSTYGFYERRFWRIVPAYYVQLAVLFLLAMPLLHGWMYWRSDLFVYALNAVAHVGFVHNLTPLTSASMGANGALWTLAVEAQYYLVVPLIAPLFVRHPWTLSCACLAIAVAWRHGAEHDFETLIAIQQAFGRHWQWSDDTVRGLLRTQLPAYAGHFALGIVLGRGWLAWRERRASRHDGALVLALGVTGLGTLWWILVRTSPLLGNHGWILGTLALGAVLFAAAADRTCVARTLLGRGPFAFAGRVSYSAYLYHLPLLYVWNRYSLFPGWACLPLYLAALLAVSWLSWRHVEERFRALASRRKWVSDPHLSSTPT